GRQKQKGLTFKPILVYTLKGKVKIEFALVKNKKKADKRDKIKKKTIDWEIKQALRR
ncbi:SsrA-binding protein, partial [Candidatus Gribaldobacteria bacterium]|nr:SsrA-binding protein [Candidatus Gribaldobacteria bacterium]